MKRKILSLLALLTLFFPVFAAETANDLLDKATERLRKAPSVQAAYTLSTGGQKYSGRLTLSGNRFCMTSPEILTWYDGKTQWSYNKSDNEVSITEPTANELSQINPFVIINAFRKNFTAKLAAAPKGFKAIELTSNQPNSEIRQATVTLNGTTLLPSQIKLTNSQNQIISISLSAVATGPKLNIKAFQFYAPNYPGVNTVDLR